MRKTALLIGLGIGACVPLAEVENPSLTAAKPAKRVEIEGLEMLNTRFDSHFSGRPGRRIHVQTDKPLYQPGETIWIKAWDLRAKDLTGRPSDGAMQYALISPKGAVVLRKWVQAPKGLSTNDFIIPDGVQGGPYKIRMRADDGVVVERPIIISAYEAPRIKKKLELLRKAYGPGDEVTATIEIKRPTGQPLVRHPVRGEVWLDGESLSPVSLRTDERGKGLIRFTLPQRIDRGDGTLTVLVEDGGVTESVSKRVPIVLKKLQLGLFPEGGQLIEGLPSRLYFEAKTPLGKPADIDGRIVDDLGNAVATFTSHHFGLGRVAFTPSTGRKYVVEITRPVGINEKYPVPVARDEGCVLETVDDLDGQRPEIRVVVRCTSTRRVVVAASLRERLLDAAGVEVTADRPAFVDLKNADEMMNRARGVARVTLLDDRFRPLAERVVFRNRHRGLTVSIEPDQDQYMPREQVALTIRTTDDQGEPAAAEVALSVVDDTVLSFADDKTGHMLAKVLLEPELPGPVEEPNFFFDPEEEKSALALELLMGTRGWRRFDWHPIVAEISATEEMARSGSGADPGRPWSGPNPSAPAMAPVPQAEPAPSKAAPARPAPARNNRARPAVARDQLAPADKGERRMPGKGGVAARKRAAARPAVRDRLVLDLGAVPQQPAEAADDEAPAFEPHRQRAPRKRPVSVPKVDAAWAGRAAQPGVAFAPVRVFPAPTYTGAFEGARTDFRETIHWAPSVQTGRNGKAVVTFYLSDAVTSFRATAEAQGANRIGRAEKVIESSLPFSMSVKLPLEVTARDRLLVPLTLSNERESPLQVTLTENFGALLSLDTTVERPQRLAAQARSSVFYPIRVTGSRGTADVRFTAQAAGLRDEFVRPLKIVPPGFPQTLDRSGRLAKEAMFEVDTGEPISGSIAASLKLYPSPVATLLSGIEGMLREPSGCFEQTSSSNYPNIMIMQYMRSTDSADPAVVERASRLLERGYQRLVGFESKNRGYEWFGRSPAHEALTAYGLLEFADMKQVFSAVDDNMIRRTAAWLKRRRDGKGGFQRDRKALDTFGRADPDITNMYIVYAMVEAGYRDFPDELAAQAAVTQQTEDPYILALGARLLLKSGTAYAEQGRAAAHRLVSMQRKDGHWVGTRHSITRSTGRNLAIETTALSVLALLTADQPTTRAGDQADAVRRAVAWLLQQRRGSGAFGATQATVLALKALTEYAIASRKTASSGSVALEINGQAAGRQAYAAGRKDPIIFAEVGRFLRPGRNTVRLRHDGAVALPYSFSVDYRAEQPANHPNAALRLETRIARTDLKMGETVRVTATVNNATNQGQPMSIVRVGVPAGLSYQTWQLKELMDKGMVAFYETRAREIILYLRQMRPSEAKTIPIDLVASVPGTYTAPASSAYLYYTDDQKHWTAPLKVRIAP